MLKYCTRCITPSTRPNITFNDEGICNGCEAHELKLQIDWSKREQSFRRLVEDAKARSQGYDCVIPVSGGKDSHWQVVTCLERQYGLRPLAVTWKTPARTEIGAKNLANLVSLGVDHIDYQINPSVERTFLYQALIRYGSTAIPMHLALFNIPLTVAAKFEIPLVVWGENAAFEYGGTEDERQGSRIDKQWLKKFGVTQGTTAEDWISSELTHKNLTPYFGPTEEELASKGVTAIFLGYYFPWDPVTSLITARSHGFQVRPEGPKTGYYNYADIDDDFISIHHYLKWYKFGCTRTFDNLSLEIRNGRMTRDEAIHILRERGDETPHEDIRKFCDFIGITAAHFFEIIEKFRNHDIWTWREGRWVMDGFLIDDWEWTRAIHADAAAAYV